MSTTPSSLSATIALAGLLWTTACSSTGLPEGYWGLAESQPIIDKTQTITLSPDLSHLDQNERAAVGLLLEAGEILHHLYEDQKHAQSTVAASELGELDGEKQSEVTQNLVTLFRLFKGPIATTLDNERLPFLPVESEVPGRNVYPNAITRAELDAFLASQPESRAAIVAGRSVVRRATAERLDRDRRTLDRFAVLPALHPGLSASLESVSPDPAMLYAVPYSVAYAEPLLEVHSLLFAAAKSLAESDPDFAAYLRLRGRDLLSDDYEGSGPDIGGRESGYNSCP